MVGRLHPHSLVVGLDIDGTQADYFRHFHWFAELYLQEPVYVDWSRGPEYSDALGIPKDVYRDIKLAYRQGGMKRSIPPMDDGTPFLVQHLREAGIMVVICTTRPWNRLDNIDPDTQFWIQRNLGRVDGVIYGEEKYEDLIDIYGHDRILGIVDDLPENIIRARQLELRTAIRTGDQNDYWFAEIPDDVEVAVSSQSIEAIVKSWKENR